MGADLSAQSVNSLIVSMTAGENRKRLRKAIKLAFRMPRFNAITELKSVSSGSLFQTFEQLALSRAFPHVAGHFQNLINYFFLVRVLPSEFSNFWESTHRFLSFLLTNRCQKWRAWSKCIATTQILNILHYPVYNIMHSDSFLHCFW